MTEQILAKGAQGRAGQVVSGPQSQLDKPKTSVGSTTTKDPSKMTERERLQASLRQTLTELKEKKTNAEKRNG